MKIKEKNRIGSGIDLSLPKATWGKHRNYLNAPNKTFLHVTGTPVANGAGTDYWPTAGWKTVTPEAQGIDSASLAHTLDAFRSRDVHSLVVVRNGYLVAEAYNYDVAVPETPQAIFSITKSVTSALAGIALAEQKLKSIDVRVAEFFPEIADDPLKSEITVRHLLSMTSGLDWNDEADQSSSGMMYAPDWIQYVLNRPAQHQPGTKFNYSNGDAHLLAAVLHKAIGQSLFEYATPRLFVPLGITNVKWNEDPQGYTIGAWAMALTTRDMAKLGMLFAKDGEWDGATIIPKAWVKDTLTKRVWLNYADGRQGGYGYMWWLKPLSQGVIAGDTKQYETFYAAGSWGQRIFVVPELHLIIAATAYSADVDMPEQLLNSVVQAVRSDRPLAESPEAVSRLEQAVQSFKPVIA
jgi:CubicO group peptidase (beta-lactamase class C family)